MINSISLLGSSSGRNAGDAALLSGIMDEVDAACKRRLHYEIPTSRPAFISANYQNDVTAVSMLPWCGSLNMLGIPTLRSLRRCELSLIFDNILFDRSLYNPLFNYMSTLRVLLPQALKRGAKMAFYNVGVGPFDCSAGKRMVRELADMASFITVRDQGSLETLLDVGVSRERMLLTADAALTVKSSPKERCQKIIRNLGLDPEKEILAVNVNRYIDTWARPKRPSMGAKKFVETYQNALSKIAKELDVQMLFVTTQHHDRDITKAVMEGVNSSKPVCEINNADYSHYDVKGVLGQVSLLFAMRLHAMILATSELTPTLGLAYQPKCKYYFDTLKLSEHMLPFSQFSESALVSHVVEGWRARSEIRKCLNAVIPVLKNHARRAAVLVSALEHEREFASFWESFQESAQKGVACG
ncbi:MAG: polysaccharide pyruvyl transferase family protein [Deltaproteobacteria bacterium]|nr:polysaccharide pyruvyl transferase family protein [Deltaproteobacteria bacterium]